MIIDRSEWCKLAESQESDGTKTSEQTEDANLNEKEKKKKARLRKRGPYRKAHADW
jgi:hypothetical protein